MTDLRRVNLITNSSHLSWPVDGAEEPAGEVDGGYDGDEDQPEPEKDEDLLVEEVNG